MMRCDAFSRSRVGLWGRGEMAGKGKEKGRKREKREKKATGEWAYVWNGNPSADFNSSNSTQQTVAWPGWHGLTPGLTHCRKKEEEQVDKKKKFDKIFKERMDTDTDTDTVNVIRSWPPTPFFIS